MTTQNLYNVEYVNVSPYENTDFLSAVVAFANGKGGTIIFNLGCALNARSLDYTAEICNVIDAEDSFEDAIKNIIAEGCEPQIFLDIYRRIVDGEKQFVVEIIKGTATPYYVKSLGIKAGTFVRNGRTSTPVDDAKLQELILSGRHEFFDESLCVHNKISESWLKQLCDKLSEISLEHHIGHYRRQDHYSLKLDDLIRFKAISKVGKNYVANQALNIITSDESYLDTSIECTVFEGKDKALLQSQKEFLGPIWRVIEDTFDYLLQNLNKHTVIELKRSDNYELPPMSLKELIVNALAHRNYMIREPIKIILFEDRIEITSPGTIVNGLNLQRVKSSYAKYRNPAVVKVLKYLGFMTGVGRGIQFVLAQFKACKLREPLFEEDEQYFKVTIYRVPYEKPYPKENDKLKYQEELSTYRTKVLASSKMKNTDKVLYLIKGDPHITIAALCQLTALSTSGISKILKKLQQDNLIKRVGSRKAGKWIII